MSSSCADQSVIVLGNKIHHWIVRVTQVFGVISAFAMAFSAFYAIWSPKPHSFWSAGLYIYLGTAFAFFAAALRYILMVPKWLFAMGILSAAFAMLTSILFNAIYIFEWMTIALFPAYMASSCMEINRLVKKNGKNSCSDPFLCAHAHLRMVDNQIF